MAVSQTLTVTEVAGSVNNSANTSKVRILWQSTQTGSSYNEYTKTAKYYVSINGGAETVHSVSYTLPKSITQKALISNARVYVSGDNLFMVAAAKGIDPSMSLIGGMEVDAYSYPTMRTISIGVTAAIVLIVFILPGMLAAFDKLITKEGKAIRKEKKKK